MERTRMTSNRLPSTKIIILSGTCALVAVLLGETMAQAEGGAVRGAARGAAVGAVGGAIAGDAKKGAAAGAAGGAVAGASEAHGFGAGPIVGLSAGIYLEPVKTDGPVDIGLGLDGHVRVLNEHAAGPVVDALLVHDGEVEDDVLARTSAGGVTVNGTILHLGSPDLPFGGVGPSGMGAYHGRFGFETFSHRKSVLSRGFGFDPKLMYPPYGKLKTKLTRRFM